MEPHRNVWLVVSAAFIGPGSAVLSKMLDEGGRFLNRPDSSWFLGLFATAGLAFLFALRPVRVPLLRGADAGLLLRDLKKVHSAIQRTTEPTVDDVERLVERADSVLAKRSPHRLSGFRGKVAKERGRYAAPVPQLDHIRVALEEIMTSLESRGS